jgi:hypothetical protein
MTEFNRRKDMTYINRFYFPFVAVSLLGLAACGQTDGDDTAAVKEETAATVPSATGAIPASGGDAPTREYMVGTWSEDPNCKAMKMTFNADGSLVGPVDRWSLNGAELTLVGVPGPAITLKVIDQNTLETRIGGTGAPRMLKRC